MAILSARQVLVDGPFDSAAAEDAGTEAALLIGGVCLLAAVLYAVLAALVPARLRVPRVAWVLVALALVAGVVAADPGERIDTFRAEPPVSEAPGATQVDAHLSTGGGSGRWQFWSAAADQWRRASAGRRRRGRIRALLGASTARSTGSCGTPIRCGSRRWRSWA